MSNSQPVTFYTRINCDLCDQAKTLLDRLAQELGFTIEAVDIDADRNLSLQYGDVVPVVVVDGEEVARAPIRVSALESALWERYR
tara:strand:+ start:11777 stop:12031 length:255 start_codon:yes stop_codon:yes gene_type:complete